MQEFVFLLANLTSNFILFQQPTTGSQSQGTLQGGSQDTYFQTITHRPSTSSQHHPDQSGYSSDSRDFIDTTERNNYPNQEQTDYQQVVIMSEAPISTDFAQNSQIRQNSNMVIGNNDWAQLTLNRPASETLQNNNQTPVSPSLSLNLNLQIGSDNFYQRINQQQQPSDLGLNMRQQSARDEQYFQNKDDMIIPGQEHPADLQRPSSLPPYGAQPFYVPDNTQNPLQQQFVMPSQNQSLSQQAQSNQGTNNSQWWP